MFNVFNEFDLLCIPKTELLHNELIRKRNQGGGKGEFEIEVLVAIPFIKLIVY